MDGPTDREWAWNTMVSLKSNMYDAMLYKKRWNKAEYLYWRKLYIIARINYIRA